MKSAKTILNHTVQKVAEVSLKNSANSTSCLVLYQPKVPVALKKFSKTENDK